MLLEIMVWLKKITNHKDFSVDRVSIDYVADPVADIDEIENLDIEWIDQSYDWTVIDGRFYWDITKEYKARGQKYLQRIIDTRPANVTDFLYTIDYYYNDRKYRFVSRASRHWWPPPEPSGKSMNFRMPIIEAWMCNENKKPQVNITNKLKKLAGWKGDFHNQEGVFVRDAIMYDLPILSVKTLLGQKFYSEDDELSVII